MTARLNTEAWCSISASSSPSTAEAFGYGALRYEGRGLGFDLRIQICFFADVRIWALSFSSQYYMFGLYLHYHVASVRGFGFSFATVRIWALFLWVNVSIIHMWALLSLSLLPLDSEKPNQ